MNAISYADLPKPVQRKTSQACYPVDHDEHFQQQPSPEDCSAENITISFACPACRGAIHITIGREPDFRFHCPWCGQAFRIDCWDPLYVLREMEEEKTTRVFIEKKKDV